MSMILSMDANNKMNDPRGIRFEVPRKDTPSTCMTSTELGGTKRRKKFGGERKVEEEGSRERKEQLSHAPEDISRRKLGNHIRTGRYKGWRDLIKKNLFGNEKNLHIDLRGKGGVWVIGGNPLTLLKGSRTGQGYGGIPRGQMVTRRGKEGTRGSATRVEGWAERKEL